MTEFLKEQANNSDPVEFLAIWAGHNQLKKQLEKQRTTVTEIQIDLKLNGKPYIVSDDTVKNVDIEHANQDKQQVIDQAKISIERKYTTSFRSMFFKQAQAQQKESRPLGNYDSKIPSVPINIEDGELPMFGSEEQLSELKKREAVMQVEKSLRELDEKISRPENSIVKESIEKSLYGKFAQFYQKHKHNALFIDKIFTQYFKGSKILDHKNRVFLFFNLPEEIIKKYRPHKIFPPGKSQPTVYSIKTMLEAFEKDKER